MNWTLWRVEVTHCVGREFPAHGIWFSHKIPRGPNESLSNIHYRILSQRKRRNLRFKFHRKQLSSRCYSRAFHQAERSINSITAMKSISHYAVSINHWRAEEIWRWHEKSALASLLIATYRSSFCKFIIELLFATRPTSVRRRREMSERTGSWSKLLYFLLSSKEVQMESSLFCPQLSKLFLLHCSNNECEK